MGDGDDNKPHVHLTMESGAPEVTFAGGTARMNSGPARSMVQISAPKPEDTEQNPAIEQYEGYRIERYQDGTVVKVWKTGAHEITWPNGNRRYVDQFGKGWLYTASGGSYEYFSRSMLLQSKPTITWGQETQVEENQ